MAAASRRSCGVPAAVRDCCVSQQVIEPPLHDHGIDTRPLGSKTEDTTGVGYDFAVAPATLTFRVVSELRFNFCLSYKENIPIHGIERKEITTEAEKKAGVRKWRFYIHLHNGQQDSITFEAMGFTQELRKPPVIPQHQWLEDDER